MGITLREASHNLPQVNEFPWMCKQDDDIPGVVQDNFQSSFSTESIYGTSPKGRSRSISVRSYRYLNDPKAAGLNDIAPRRTVGLQRSVAKVVDWPDPPSPQDSQRHHGGIGDVTKRGQVFEGATGDGKIRGSKDSGSYPSDFFDFCAGAADFLALF